MPREMLEVPNQCDDYLLSKPSDNPNNLNNSSHNNINNNNNSVSYTHQQQRSCFARHRKLILTGSVILTLGAVSALIALLVTRPWDTNQDRNSSNSTGGGTPASLSRFTESSTVPISSSVRCNDITPPLNQPFLYGQQPIRGVNLGGWLVLEPFITPSVFEPYIGQGVIDEYSLTKLLGPTAAREHLKKHYASWVTENTFKRIRDLGLNHVRIPLGFWALGNLASDEPYVPDLSLDYLLLGLKWAAKYGIRVMVELHGAPGSQNGWNHSGRAGKIRWLDGTEQGEVNGQRTIDYMKKLLKLLQGDGMEHVSPMFGILNEPAIFMLERERTDKWYKQAFAEMRNITGPGKGPWAVIHDGFLGLTQWEGFMPNSDRLALDAHQYLIFDSNLIRLSPQQQVNFPCDVWSESMQQSSAKFGPTLVGEFSSAANDCATHLNGIGVGSRWDGTFQSEEDIVAGGTPTPAEAAACQPSKNGQTEAYCSCRFQNTVGSYTPEYKKFLSDFTQTQMDAFEQGLGWFYWNFKTETNALWSYFDGVDQGWIPKNANSRTGGCAVLGRPITPLGQS
ncbi:hypothetical protein BG004_000668 [Podila humilis]|nr:hypothetical protein BG004_000668 [Podila humilis]